MRPIGTGGPRPGGLSPTLGAFLVLTLAGPADAQILRAELTAHATGGADSAAVTVLYALLPGDDGTLPLRGLAFGHTRVEGLRVALGPLPGRQLLPFSAEPEMEGEAGGYLRGRVALPPQLRGADSLRLQVSYTVREARVDRGSDLRYRLPVMVAGEPPREALPGTFTARIHLPGEVSVHESFPTGFRTAPDSPGQVELSLQVVPAVVTLRARMGEAPLLAPLRLLDLGAVLLLAALGAWGLRALSREGSRADEAGEGQA